MRTRILGCLAALLLVVCSPHASRAAAITLSGGTAGTIPAGTGVNDFIGTVFPAGLIGGFYGSQIQFSVPGTSTIVFDFYGGEADFNNEFDYGAQLFAHTAGLLIAPSLAAPLATFSTTITGSGTLAFVFDVHSDAGHVIDGSNPNDFMHNTGMPNFFASCNPFGHTAGAGGTTCDSVYLFLDDSGGGPDDDYDDMFVRVTISTVPEPATLLLLGAGLVGGSIFVRRRKQ